MRLRISILAGLAILLLPGSSIATSLTVKIPEMVAGIGGEADISGLAPEVKGTLVVKSPSLKTISLPFTSDRQGSAILRILGTNVQEAGAYTASLQLQMSGEATSTSFNVLPDKLDTKQSTVRASTSNFSPDGRDSATVTLTLMDRFGNPLSGRPVQLISSRSDDQVRSTSSTTDEHGVMEFTIRTNKAGTITLRAFDLLSAVTLDDTVTLNAGTSMSNAMGADSTGLAPYPQYAPAGYPPQYYQPYPYYYPPTAPYSGLSQFAGSLFGGLQGQVQNFGIVDHFEISLDPAKPHTNDAVSMTLTAVDANGHTVPSYKGTVVIKCPTDPNAVLPGIGLGENGDAQVTFRDVNQGVLLAPLSVVFRKSGDNVIIAKEINGDKGGQATFTVTGQDVIAEGDRIVLTNPTKNGYVNSLTFKVEGITSPLINLVVKGIGFAQDQYLTESDQDGKFSVQVTLKPGQSAQHILRVQTPDAKRDSGDWPFTVDIDPPKMTNFTVMPQHPRVGDSVLISVETEPKATVRIKLDNKSFDLLEGNPGLYQVAITAPEAGNYPVPVAITDPGGNTVTSDEILKVDAPGLPIVENLQGVVKDNKVQLTWDPVEGAVSYMIYVGKTPDSFESISTGKTQKNGKPPTNVMISDLDAASTYFFYVTAVSAEGGEGAPSDIISVLVLGLKLVATPINDGLQLKWLIPDDPNNPLAGFLLQYGVDTYTERRLINPALRDLPIHDLIDGLTYKVKLTPIAINGSPMTALAAETTGKVPDFSGFRPLAGEVVSGTPGDQTTAPPDTLHAGAPSTSASGLPRAALILAFAFAAVLTLFMVRSRRQMQRDALAFFSAVDDRYRQ